MLKLLKTLNSALSDNSLPESHIEEAFEVWWPRLESQLKALPNEDSHIKPHRPDRELLEEILALVRNQNRSSMIDPETVVETFNKIVAAAMSVDGDIDSGGVTSLDGDAIQVSLKNSTSDRTYPFSISTSADDERIKNLVKFQMSNIAPLRKGKVERTK